MKYTLEQLEGMSDKQISEAVLSLITGYSIDEAREIISTGYFSKSSFCDYCNSWADMGPLIHEAKISLSPCYSADPVVYSYSPTGKWCAEHFYLQSGQVTNTNPLRAAAIVYILIKQEDY